MSKYIIEIPDGVEWGVVTCRTEDGFYTRDFDSLEELNSDYINEHFGELQDEAYQRGLEDAWEAARKIIHMPEGDLLNIFTECYSAVCTALQVLLKYDAAEAIDKIKAYEDKQKEDDSIKVGDEVATRGSIPGNTFLVTKVTESTAYGISNDGSWNFYNKDSVTKTGKHYDIQSILEAMRE